MADNNQYTLPPDLSSILATLAQYTPQSTASPSQPVPPPALPPNGNVQQPHYQPQQSDEIAAILAAAAAQAQPHPNPPIDSSRLPGYPHPGYPSYRNPYNDPAIHPFHPQHQPHDQQRTLDPRRAPSLRAGVSHPSPSPTPPPSSRSAAVAQQQIGPIIDPATITVWSEGLRCVNKIATQNREFAGAIRRLISNQQKHEMQWYSSRQDLKQTQARRGNNIESINNIFTSLSSTSSSLPPFSASTTAPSSTYELEGAAKTEKTREEENVEELMAFDAKVYRAQVAMHDSMEAELKALGVPFFGTRADRLLLDETDNHTLTSGTGDSSGDGGMNGEAKWSPRITKRELLGLKKRMVGFLEDMYKE